jgi:PAS domain S-box-containing protein
MSQGREGTQGFMVVLVEDMSKRKSMEDAVRISEAAYRTLAENLPGAVFRLDLSGENRGNMKFFNNAIEDMTGYKLDELREGSPCGVAHLIMEEDMPQVRKKLMRSIEDGSEYELDYRIRHRNGEVKCFEERGVPVQETQEGALRIDGVIFDVTERRKMEETIRQAEAAWRNTFDSISDAVSVHDRDFRIVRANKALANLCQLKPEEIIGRYCYELFHPSGKPPGHCPHVKMLEEGRSITEEVQDEKTGIPQLETASPLRNDAGEIIGSVHVSKDITALKMIEEDLRQSLDEREVLIREVYHRVKNNLNIISSLLRLQSRETKDEKTIALFMESQNRVNTMSMIHEKLYRSGDLTSIAMQEYLRELVVHIFRSMETHPGVNLVMDVEDVTLGIDTVIPCALIVNELVTNALKYAFRSERNGELHVRFHSDESGEKRKYALSVRDNGVGIPEGFDLNKTRTLGAQIINSLAAQLDGTVEVVSLEPGTDFRVTLKEKQSSDY